MEIKFIKNLDERLLLCRKCKNRGYEVTIGLLCALTGKKPVFEMHCQSYHEDKLAIQKSNNTIYSKNKEIYKESNPFLKKFRTKLKSITRKKKTKHFDPFSHH